MRLRTLGTVHTHTPSLYQITEKEINKIEIDKRGLCQYVDRHN